MALGNKNVNFKVSVTVNGQKQVADLEMSMEDLADITEAVTTESRKLKGALNETMVNMAAMSTVINSVASATESLSRGYASFDRSSGHPFPRPGTPLRTDCIRSYPTGFPKTTG